MARDSARKLTPEVERYILTALSVGAYRTDAARLAGISPTTLYKWIEKGESARPNTKLGKFAVKVADAEARPKLAAMRTLLDSIRGDPANNVPGNPRIALDFLRRRYPDEWGGAERIQIDAVHHLAGAKSDATESLADLGLNDDQIHLLGTQLARLESGQVPVPALTMKRPDEDDDSWVEGEEGVDWEWEYVVEDGEEE